MRTFSLHINMKLYSIEKFSRYERMHVKIKIVTHIRKLLQATVKTKHVWFSVTVKTKYAWQKLWKILSSNHLSSLLHLGNSVEREVKYAFGRWEGVVQNALQCTFKCKTEWSACWSFLLSCYVSFCISLHKATPQTRNHRIITSVLEALSSQDQKRL